MLSQRRQNGVKLKTCMHAHMCPFMQRETSKLSLANRFKLAFCCLSGCKAESGLSFRAIPCNSQDKPELHGLNAMYNVCLCVKGIVPQEGQHVNNVASHS